MELPSFGIAAFGHISAILSNLVAPKLRSVTIRSTEPSSRDRVSWCGLETALSRFPRLEVVRFLPLKCTSPSGGQAGSYTENGRDHVASNLGTLAARNILQFSNPNHLEELVSDCE